MHVLPTHLLLFLSSSRGTGHRRIAAPRVTWRCSRQAKRQCMIQSIVVPRLGRVLGVDGVSSVGDRRRYRVRGGDFSVLRRTGLPCGLVHGSVVKDDRRPVAAPLLCNDTEEASEGASVLLALSWLRCMSYQRICFLFCHLREGSATGESLLGVTHGDAHDKPSDSA